MNMKFNIGGKLNFAISAGTSQQKPTTPSCTHTGVMTLINTAGFIYGTAGILINIEETEES